ncbi:MAG TPA: haloacid dehalogenase type II [Actinomycetota bacterium]|nr:haloacid dehalogenase type II [Actinomycetota bacterium]
MARVLVFDVNETLLDLAALRAPFARAFGDAAPLGEWFARLLHASLVATLTDSYEDFASIGRRALEAGAARRGLDLPDADRDAILGTMRRLPAHPDVPDALERLHSAGFPLATLTNSSGGLVRAQLEHAGILELFDQVLSVEDVRRYKPAPEPYHMAAERLGVPPSEMRMVAAHDWDVWGAMRAGCAAAYVSRTEVPFVLGRPPDLVGPDLSAVADAILGVDEPPR